MLDLLDDTGFKLNLKKSSLFEPEIKWCGRIITAEGIKHDPKRLQALYDMGTPTTAGDLMQFNCAAGWLRSAIPYFAVLAEPLNKIVQDATTNKKKTKRVASNIKIEMKDVDILHYELIYACVCGLMLPTWGGLLSSHKYPPGIKTNWRMTKITNCSIVPAALSLARKQIGRLSRRNVIQWPKPVPLWITF